MTAAEGDDTAVFDFDDDVATDGAEKEVSFHNCSFFLFHGANMWSVMTVLYSIL